MLWTLASGCRRYLVYAGDPFDPGYEILLRVWLRVASHIHDRNILHYPFRTPMGSNHLGYVGLVYYTFRRLEPFRHGSLAYLGR